MIPGFAMMLAPKVESVAPLPTVTWNPADNGGLILSNGDLTATRDVIGSFRSVRATLGKSSGKHYFEVRQDAASGANYSFIGVCKSSVGMGSGQAFPVSADGYGYYEETGEKTNNNATTAFGASYTAGDVIGVAVDMSAGKIWFSKNGTWQASGDPGAGTNPAFTGLSGEMFPVLSLYSNVPNTQMTGRFRSADFSYSPPAGFSPWGG